MTAAVLAGFVLVVAALYGLATTRNLVRLLIALEALTVGAFTMISPALVATPEAAYYGLLLLVITSVSEASIFAALIYRTYALTKASDVEALSSGGEP